MKSVLFLVALSFCASCCLFAEEAIPSQQIPIEESQEINIPQDQDLACTCDKSECSECDQLACDGCKALLIACSKCKSTFIGCSGCKTLTKCGCKDKLMIADSECKEENQSYTACPCKKSKPATPPIFTCKHKKTQIRHKKTQIRIAKSVSQEFACECETLETEEAAA